MAVVALDHPSVRAAINDLVDGGTKVVTDFSFQVNAGGSVGFLLNDYREDELLDEQGEVVSARARLTLTGPSREAAFGSVLLFRSRFIAPAVPALRTETTVNQPRDFGIGKELTNLAALAEVGYSANRRLLDAECISHDPAAGAAARAGGKTSPRGTSRRGEPRRPIRIR